MRPRCTQKSIGSEELERQVDAFLNRLTISERFRKWAVTYLHELHDKEIASRNEVIKSQQRAYEECLRRLDSLVKLKTSPSNLDGSQLSDEEYGNQRVQLLKQKANLEELLQDTGHRVEQWLKLTEQTFEFARTARDRFAKGDYLVKKEILLAVGSNLILRDKKLCIEAKKPFLLLESCFPGHADKTQTFEPEKTIIPQGRKGASVPVRPNLCATGDEPRTLCHENELLVKSIYHFFQKECMSVSFRMSDWNFLFHAPIMDEDRKQKKAGDLAANGKVWRKHIT
jgi:hypothetical protein